jgi:hypothetical protein
MEASTSAKKKKYEFMTFIFFQKGGKRVTPAMLLSEHDAMYLSRALLLAATVAGASAEVTGTGRSGMCPPAGLNVCWVPCLSTVFTPGACVRVFLREWCVSVCVREGDADVASGARFVLLAGTGGAPHTGAGTRRSGGHDTRRLAGPQLYGIQRQVWGAILNSQKSRYGEFYIVNVLGY